VGILLYLTHFRPDLSYAVGIVSRFMQEPHDLHWKATKCILLYVHDTINFGIHYAIDSTLDLIEFTDFDYAGNKTDRKYTSGYSLSLGSRPICWLSKKHATISLYFSRGRVQRGS
jgi:hypothetical protein